jgi:hypothetical protein
VARTLRIPGLLDVVRARDPGEIEALAADTRLDRKFAGAGPLVNRIITGRIRRNLHVQGTPLPPVSARDAPGRAAQQADLETALTAVARGTPCDPADLDKLAMHVLGNSAPEELGPLVQQVAGRLFVPGYHGSRRSFADARLLDASVRTLNPVRRLVWWIAGSIGRARRRLAALVGNDRSGVHATGIAVHNLVHSIERMRDLASQRGALGWPSSEEALARCLSAPQSVLREAIAPGTTAAASFRPGTLVMLLLEEARARHCRRDLAFMSASWSRCPAHAWVTSLLTAVWERAVAISQGRHASRAAVEPAPLPRGVDRSVVP